MFCIPFDHEIFRGKRGWNEAARPWVIASKLYAFDSGRIISGHYTEIICTTPGIGCVDISPPLVVIIVVGIHTATYFL